MHRLEYLGTVQRKILVDGPEQPDGTRVFAATALYVTPGGDPVVVDSHVATVIMTDITLEPLFRCTPPIGKDEAPAQDEAQAEPLPVPAVPDVQLVEAAPANGFGARRKRLTSDSGGE